MKNILIWDLGIPIANIGGPSGYLFNIKKEIEESEGLYNIVFLSDIIDVKNLNISYNNNRKGHQTIKILLRWIKRVTDLDKIPFWRGMFKCYKKGKFESLNLNDYEVIHFHTSYHLCQAKLLLEDFRGKVILTSHCPLPLSHEITDYSVHKNNFLIRVIKNYSLKKELEAWERADYLLFPVPDSIEPYLIEKSISKYYYLHKDKFIYCPTGILPKTEIRYNREEIFSNCINANEIDKAYIIVYIGRHNEVKGYAFLKKIAEKVLKEFPNVYFVIGGKEGPIPSLDNERWIELGWINYGGDLMANADLFILPNKDTYFDLIALEALRSGVPILLTRTGGNKHFESLVKEDKIGIEFVEFGDTDSAIERINEMRNRNLYEMRISNKKLFERDFTTRRFLTRYIKLLDNL